MKCPLFKNNFLYYLIKENKVFNYPKKYQNGYTYYVDLDNDLLQISYTYTRI